MRDDVWTDTAGEYTARVWLTVGSDDDGAWTDVHWEVRRDEDADGHEPARGRLVAHDGPEYGPLGRLSAGVRFKRAVEMAQHALSVMTR